MRSLPHPRSRGFRAMLCMALLAWAMLASGALTAAPGMQAAMASAMQLTATPAPAPDCEGMPMQHAAAQHHVPMAPMGHGDCCHGGCHCLSVCNAVLTVPGLLTAAMPPQASPALLVQAGLVRMVAAPPLRPPIA